MKTVGIIGGIGPESTIEYYRFIVSAYREQKKDGSYPPIIINSIDLKKMVNWFEASDFISIVEYLVAAIHKLAKAGADFALVAANTPHIVFADVERQSPIPLISIVEATCREATAQGMKRVGLFGTRFTMQGGFYAKVFTEAGLEIFVPEPDDQEFIHQKYMNELVPGIIRPETREALLKIAAQMQQRHAIQGLILGGTELPLILRDEAPPGIRFLDTTQIHVNAAVSELLA